LTVMTMKKKTSRGTLNIMNDKFEAPCLLKFLSQD
jgi:hypothetical protein